MDWFHPHVPSHRAEGPVGSFTIHSPGDYVPKHRGEPALVWHDEREQA